MRPTTPKCAPLETALLVPLTGPNSAIGIRISPPITTPSTAARKPCQNESPKMRIGKAPSTTVANVFAPPKVSRKRSSGVGRPVLRRDRLDAVELDLGDRRRLTRLPHALSFVLGHRAEREQLVPDRRRVDGRHLTRPVELRRHLHDVVAHELDPGERPQEGQRLVRQQPADLGRARARREGGVEHVDVERQERRPARQPLAHAPPVLLRRPAAQLVAGHDLEPPPARLVEVGRRVQRPAHAGQQRPLGRDQPLLERAPERRAVEVALAVVAVPGVGVGVEQDDAERAVALGVRAQLAEDDRVVAAEHERGGAGARPRGRRPSAICAAVRSALPGVTVEVAAVDHGQRREHVDGEGGVPRAQELALLADRGGPEARAGAIARGRVERHAEDGDVGVLPVGGCAGSARRCGCRCSAERRGVRRPVDGLPRQNRMPHMTAASSRNGFSQRKLGARTHSTREGRAEDGFHQRCSAPASKVSESPAASR